MYGTPSPFTLSLNSLNVEHAVIGPKARNTTIIIFFIIIIYNFSIFAAQYLNSGIFPYGSNAGLVSKFAAASL